MSHFYQTFKQQSQPPALDMSDRILCLQSMLQITTLYNHDKN